MFVGVSGAHGVGKTTLCNKLADALFEKGYNAIVLTEIARKIIEKRGYDNGAGDVQKDIFWKQIEVEAKYRTSEYEKWIIISDRTVIDSIAYSNVYLDLDFYQMNPTIKPIMKEWMKGYDLIFFMRTLDNWEDDGIRDSKDSQERIDKELDFLLHESYSEDRIYEVNENIDIDEYIGIIEKKLKGMRP